MEMTKEFIEKLPLYLWGALGSLCLAGVVFAGAWWHLGTTAICALMFLVSRAEIKEKDDEQQ